MFTDSFKSCHVYMEHEYYGIYYTAYRYTCIIYVYKIDLIEFCRNAGSRADLLPKSPWERYCLADVWCMYAPIRFSRTRCLSVRTTSFSSSVLLSRVPSTLLLRSNNNYHTMNNNRFLVPLYLKYIYLLFSKRFDRRVSH